MGSEQGIREFVLACIIAILMVALFAAAGTSDYQTEQAYLRTWYEQNGVNQ